MPPKRKPLTSIDLSDTAWGVVEEGGRGMSGIRKKQMMDEGQKERIHQLPPPPAFDFFISPHPPHEGSPQLPESCDLSPLAIFQLFYSDEVLDLIASNTNRYAELKVQELEGRIWKSTSGSELKIFIGLQIHMGIYRYPALEDYWENGVKHPMMKMMSLVRYEQLKRYLHVSPPDEAVTQKDWWRKLEPLASDLRQKYQQYYLPSSNLSYDEMMISFEGRSIHIIKMPNKPIDQGYKVYALCDHGYTWTFLFYSGAVGNEESELTESTNQFANLSNERAAEIFRVPFVQSASKPKDPSDMRFSPTAKAVCHLVFSLPYESYQFNIYMDNYFTSIPLFRHLRLHGIGAAGTTRAGRLEFPKELDITKSFAKSILEWNFISAKVVDGVCVVLWQDNNTVLFLTTIHDVQEYILSLRTKPGSHSTNAKEARKPFGGENKKVLPIPVLVFDYNQNMGGVDIADQLRSAYTTHQKTWRNWLSIWFWLLDMTIVNSFRIYKHYNLDQPDQKHFRKQLAATLVEKGYLEMKPYSVERIPHFSSKITVKTDLPPFPLRNPFLNPHTKEVRTKKTQCWYCRYKKMKLAGPTTGKGDGKRDSKSYNQNVSQTTVWCKWCNLPLCERRNCFSEYHRL